MAPIRIGVLALQGSFREHTTLLNRVPGVEAVEIRTIEQLRSVSGLIIPGGESTTMALVAEKWGLIPELQSFAAARQPIWGTCAGLIFLANRATGMKEGGQALLGGLDCLVHRNFFGAQINSFETMLPAPACLPSDGQHEGPFRAVFIRAPSITETGPGVEILAEYTLSPEEKAAQGRDSVAVAVRSGNLLATAFHPELTEDARWHAMFVQMVKENLGTEDAANGVGNGSGADVDVEKLGRAPTRPADLPVY
ncbi:putative pyridoxal 5'-phosphate synthase subunit PDX2 [Nannochloris sp. 'desiccata']|nr:putative pyridoxal 5'-phosphate synthase subunit PDX2 [Chlorella desiccata (nom. nud.)]